MPTAPRINAPKIYPPASRRLRVLAFDPSLLARLETATVNQLTLKIPWENLDPGPVGEYVEVVDVDPASNRFYFPVDLDDRNLALQDGLEPSESDPRFHQQMVYAVAMTIIRQFERALGRAVLWATHRATTPDGEYAHQFVRRLRIYPHALRDQNAYYSPAKKALLFGYFPATINAQGGTAGNYPAGAVIYTCLSHDIIAHETTHALLDGLHPRFAEATNPDVRAFHEAFADIVALFQHFSYPAVLESQISRTRGNLESEHLLSQLAQQFGMATGRGGALRDALGGINPETGRWEQRKPDPTTLRSVFSAHERGSILVAAVFRAFLTIYRDRTADLYRIATGGTGTLPEGEIHPDLTRRLAAEASRCADRVLQMCIRAMDYVPPVDITFGDFLRAVVTADIEFAPDEEESYRTVFVQSFREWGIHPRSLVSLGMDVLAWPNSDDMRADLEARSSAKPIRGVTVQPVAFMSTQADLKEKLKFDFFQKRVFQTANQAWTLTTNRFDAWKASDELRFQFLQWLLGGDQYGKDYGKLFGLVVDARDAPRTVFRNKEQRPTIEVHSVRPTIRRTVNGTTRTDLVVEITQRRRGYFDPEIQKKKDLGGLPITKADHDFVFRAGCTLLFDVIANDVRRIIRTPGTIADNDELERVRRYRCGETSLGIGNAFDAGVLLDGDDTEVYEPFALLHAEME